MALVIWLIEKVRFSLLFVFGYCRRSWQGVQRGAAPSAYWGFLALWQQCGSKNPLIGYGIFLTFGKYLRLRQQ